MLFLVVGPGKMGIKRNLPMPWVHGYVPELEVASEAALGRSSLAILTPIRLLT